MHLTPQLWELGAFFVFWALLSTLCTICAIYLIYAMKKWNGYIILVLSLIVCQLIYNITFVFVGCYDEVTCQALMNLFAIFAGVATALWTNVISILIAYIVIYLKSLDIMTYYKSILMWICIPSAMLGILGMYSSIDEHSDNRNNFLDV